MYKKLKIHKPKEEIASELIQVLHTLGLTPSSLSPDNLKHYAGKVVPYNEPSDLGEAIGCYLFRLIAASAGSEMVPMPEQCKAQVRYSQRKNLLSIYSAVIACLVGNALDEKQPYHLVIGYLDAPYGSRWFKNLQKVIALPSLEKVQLHAVACVHQRLLDPCYYLQSHIEPKDDTLVYGTYPKGSALYGWEMDDILVDFVLYFAKAVGMTTEDFITTHIQAFTQYLNTITSMQQKRCISL